MNKNVLEIKIYKEVNCSKEVAFWNYWDHEHLDIVHEGYHKSDIFYDKNNYLFRIDLIKIPIIPFLKFVTPIFAVQHNENQLITYAVQMGVISKTTITINAINASKCSIEMNYKFYLNGWRKILRFLLKKLVPIWNEKVWQEDLPVKLRRQKILDLGFKDFVGLPKEINERKKNQDYKLKLPIPRPKKSTRDLHPLSIKNSEKI
jgi:hypothetical protein